MIPRVLEPEVMDTPQEAADYDAMDHAEVNRVFVDDLLASMSAGPPEPRSPGTPFGAGLPTPPTAEPKIFSIEGRPTVARVARSGDRATTVPRSPTRVLDVGTGTAQIPIELCRREEFTGQVVGVDLAEAMLKLARRNITTAGLGERVQVERVDGKSLPYDDGVFDVVMSNSIVHHIPEPAVVLAEIIRVLRPGGLMFVRDLLRPKSDAEVEHLVSTYAGNELPHAQQLFRQSLHAALTAEEMQDLAAEHGLTRDSVRATSDRHWTLAGRRPEASSPGCAPVGRDPGLCC